MKDCFSFLQGHIRRKGVSKSSAFKSPQRPCAAAASASVPDTSRYTESEMEISIASDVTHQPSSTSLKRQKAPVMTTTTAADPVLDQFQQMRSVISSFLGACQDSTSSPQQLFCNYFHSEIEHLEQIDFLTFGNETVKLLCEFSTRPKNDRSPKVNRPLHFNFQKQHRPQQDVNTYHTGFSTSFHSSCAASTDSHNRACYSDCQSTATIKDFISVSTANFLRCSG